MQDEKKMEEDGNGRDEDKQIQKDLTLEDQVGHHYYFFRRSQISASMGISMGK